MIRLFIVLFGFWMVLPVGLFLTFSKRIALCLALSVAALDFEAQSSFFAWWNRELFQIFSECLVLVSFGALMALPFLIVSQLIESVIESLEIIRGVSLSSVLSPLTEQHEIPLVVLISCSLISFLFIGSSFYYNALYVVFKFSSIVDFSHLPDLMMIIEVVAKTFSIYPSFFLMIVASMITSDLALQFLQKLFPQLVLQDFGFLFRTVNAFILLLGVLPNCARLIADLLNSSVKGVFTI